MTRGPSTFSRLIKPRLFPPLTLSLEIKLDGDRDSAEEEINGLLEELVSFDAVRL